MRALVERMKNSDVEFQGSLAFVKDWQLFWSSEWLTGVLYLLRNSPLSLTGAHANVLKFQLTILR